MSLLHSQRNQIRKYATLKNKVRHPHDLLAPNHQHHHQFITNCEVKFPSTCDYSHIGTESQKILRHIPEEMNESLEGKTIATDEEMPQSECTHEIFNACVPFHDY